MELSLIQDVLVVIKPQTTLVVQAILSNLKEVLFNGVQIMTPMVQCYIEILSSVGCSH